MQLARLLCVLFVSSGQILRSQAPAPQQTAIPEPKTSIEWFSRANDQLNIRMPGSASFHMKVSFHALPGIEYLGKGEEPKIITGDGIYEETWVAPHHWRREVTFANYHAIEVESDHGRKMRTSTDYEPSRVMMLLSGLLDPVPRHLISREYQRSRAAKGWHIDHLASEATSLVRIVRRDFSAFSAEFNDAYYFSPRGLLLLRDQDGLTTAWSNGTTFADKIVFTRVVVSAGERVLLTADVTIAAEGRVDPGEFEVEGGSSDAGMTLRPLHIYEFKTPICLSADPIWPGENHSALRIHGVLDRTGRYREVELIVSINPGADRDLRELMRDFRKSRWSPAEIDGYACQIELPFLYVKETQNVGPAGHGPS